MSVPKSPLDETSDILPVQPAWPVDPRVECRQADQGSEDLMAAALADLPPPQLIDYQVYRCRCGVELYAEADSMSVAIVKSA